MSSNVCGTGVWSGPLPGDPDTTNTLLTATPAFGGIDVSWTAAVTNPHAVAHTYLYRSTANSDFLSAIRIATVGGTHFYDKLEELFTYYYWIQVVSINGTVGPVIGPASAVPRLSIDETIIALTGRIDNGMLAQALRADIDRIDLLDIDLSAEINERLLANEALGAALEQVRGEAGQAVTLIQNEITQRTDAQGALLTSIDALAVGFNENAAAIITERETRVTQTEALASDVSTLYTEVGNNTSAIINEASARTSADTSLAETFTGLLAQSENTVLGELSSAITLEQSARTSGFDAVATQLSSIQATIADIEGGADYSAALQVEQSARVAADEALGQQITTVQATATSKGKAIFSATAPAVADRQTNNVWYDTTGGNNTPKMWNGTAWVGVSDKVATDALSKANTNAAAIQTETTARINADAALASQITTVQSTLGNDIASAQTSLQTNINTVNGKVTDIGALYTAKVGVNGLIGGFGVYNDGTEVQAGFDVDTFWVGRTGPDKKKPFIIDSVSGETYIDKAVIPTLTADMIDTKGLSIKDMSGNVILSSGTALDWSRIGGSLKAANNATVGATFGDYNGAGKNISGTITPGNVTTYIANAAIGNAQIANASITNAKIANATILAANIADANITNAKIANAAITNAKIGNAAVNTLQIAGNAVTVPVHVRPAPFNGRASGWTTIATAWINAGGSVVSIFVSASVRTTSSESPQNIYIRVLSPAGTQIGANSVSVRDALYSSSTLITSSTEAGTYSLQIYKPGFASFVWAEDISLFLIGTKR